MKKPGDLSAEIDYFYFVYRFKPANIIHTYARAIRCNLSLFSYQSSDRAIARMIGKKRKDFHYYPFCCRIRYAHLFLFNISSSPGVC